MGDMALVQVKRAEAAAAWERLKARERNAKEALHSVMEAVRAADPSFGDKDYRSTLMRWLANGTGGNGVPKVRWQAVEVAFGCQPGELTEPATTPFKSKEQSGTNPRSPSHPLTRIANVELKVLPGDKQNTTFADPDRQQTIKLKVTAVFQRVRHEWIGEGQQRYVGSVSVSSAEVVLSASASSMVPSSVFGQGEGNLLGKVKVLDTLSRPELGVTRAWAIESVPFGRALDEQVAIESLAELFGKFPGTDSVVIQTYPSAVDVLELANEAAVPTDRVGVIKEHIRRRILENALRRSFDPDDQRPIVLCASPIVPPGESE